MESEYENDINPILQSSDRIIDPLLKKRESIFKRTINSASELLTTTCIFLLFIAVIIFTTAVPISQVVIGSLYKNACPLNRLIPIYLIVAGAATLVLLIVSILKIIIERSCCWSFLHILVAVFCFVWFILVSVVIFQAKKIVQYNDPNDLNTYCEYSVFICAYGTIFISYGFLIGTVCFSTKYST